MSLATKIRQEGLEKGVEKGKIAVATRMLEEGSDPAFITKVTGLSLSQIKKLQGK